MASLITIEFTVLKLAFCGLIILQGIVLVLEFGKNKRFPLVGVLLFLVSLALFAINELSMLADIKATLSGLVSSGYAQEWKCRIIW